MVKNLYDGTMTLRNTLFPLYLLLLVLVAPASAADKGRFSSIIDGDSMRMEIDGRVKEVRLIGIDAPEWGQEYGKQAKEFALRFCYGQELRLEYDKERKDKYGRILAYVYRGNRMLNEEIVRAGLALAVRYKPNTRHHTRLVRAQKEAEKAKRGFWSRGGLKMTPREWRKRNRK